MPSSRIHTMIAFALSPLLAFGGLGGARDASALSLQLESSGGTVLIIDDNMPGDTDPTVGSVVANESIDSFVVVVAAGLSKPLVGDATTAQLDVSLVTSTGGSSGSLILTVTDTDYLAGTGDGSLTSSVGGTTAGLTSFQTFVDAGNIAFETMGATVCTSGLQGPFSSGAFNNSVAANCPVAGPFAITVVAEISIPANSVQSFGGSAAVVVAGTPLACRFTGGGVDTDLNWNHVLEDGETIRNGAGNLPAGIDRYQFGGQVGARTAQQPQPSGEWQHHQQTGPSGSFSFHGGTSSAASGTRIVDVRCSDPGFCNQARPAPAKQLDFDAIGTFSNLGKGKSAPTFEIVNPNVIPEPNGKKGSPFTFHWFEVNIDDMGEPGGFNSGQPNSVACPGRGFGEKSGGPYVPDPIGDPGTVVILPATDLGNCDCPDFYRITIYRGVLSTEVTFLPDGGVDPASLDRTTVIYQGFGYIDGGNLQIHPPTGFDTN